MTFESMSFPLVDDAKVSTALQQNTFARSLK